MQQITLKKKLRALKKQSTNALEVYCIEDLLEQENIQGYIEDLLQHGCISGMVSALIYYTDTREFFSKYMDEIDELKQEDEESTGEPLKMGTPLYNWLAWYGYERMIYKIASNLNII